MSPRRREAFEAGGLNVKNCNASSRLSGRDVNAKGEELCRHGCGGDTCKKMTPLPVTRIVNLGEIGAPMNGAFWTSSHRWPLTTKMARTDFQPASVGRLERLSQFDIAWVIPRNGRHNLRLRPAIRQSMRSRSSNQNTDMAISTAGGATGNALNTTYGNVKNTP